MHRRRSGPLPHHLGVATPESHQVLRDADLFGSIRKEQDPDQETYRWNVHDDRRRDFWGNAVIESWYKEATPVLDLEGNQQPVSDGLG
ncbi:MULTISPECIES: hypothetical protein [unclassified Streptomyces]|uniref:hypothetical protein n=1 Tax=unclassified Streptomyces TaxID=2593676 RepID=UPI0022541D2F|nr:MULTISPECIES: hypothetical protein [unclassified Streptomyces]MCX5336113.1 hypothetical protein [Streptomyces sp. NBC_00140]MCX5366835.1 hypothetical protein [Streptomyces sp. NBC_00124]